MSENTAPKVSSSAGKPVMLKCSNIIEKDGLFILPQQNYQQQQCRHRAEANMNHVGANKKAHCCWLATDDVILFQQIPKTSSHFLWQDGWRCTGRERTLGNIQQ